MIKNNEFDDHYVSGLIDLGDDANIQQPMEYRRGQTMGRGGEWGYIYMGSKIYLLINYALTAFVIYFQRKGINITYYFVLWIQIHSLKS